MWYVYQDTSCLKWASDLVIKQYPVLCVIWNSSFIYSLVLDLLTLLVLRWVVLPGWACRQCHHIMAMVVSGLSWLCVFLLLFVCFLISLDLLCTKFHIMFLYHMFHVICSLILFQFLYLEFSFSVVMLLVFVVLLSLSLEKGRGETCIDWSSVHHCKHAII